MSHSFLVKDVRIFDGEEEIPKGNVLVVDGLIREVSVDSIAQIDDSTIVLSKPGHTLIPGIIDGHVHAPGADEVALTQSLALGITTICDMHQEAKNVPILRTLAKENPDAADFKTCSEAATIQDGWPAAVVTAHDKSEETLAVIASWPKLETKNDVADYMKSRVSDKADYIKLMHEDGTCLTVKPAVPSLELQKQVIQAAHAHGLITVAHATSIKSTIDILNAGVDGLTHTFLDHPPTPELIEAYKRNNAHCNPTLAALGSLTKQGKDEQEAYAHDPRIQHLLPEDGKARLCRCMALANEKANVENAYQTVRQLHAEGIDIILGSDSAGPALGTAFGVSAHHELALLVRECGFTPAEALRSGTFLVAKRLGFADRGSIKQGLRADMVLVEGNPLADIKDTLNLRAVWKEGVLCSAYKK